jgi:hypothetical protein
MIPLVADAQLPASSYTRFGFHLVALLDKGEVLDLDETSAHLKDGSLFDWLKGRFGGDVDVTTFDAIGGGRHQALEFFQTHEITEGASRYDIHSNGIALLLAYCLEAAQELARRD